jgi:hypothetical protein
VFIFFSNLLMEAGRQIPRQHLSPFGQTLGAGWIRTARGLRLLDEVPDLIHLGLLILAQLPPSHRIQAGLGMGKALIDGRVVLLLLVRRKDISQFGRRRGGCGRRRRRGGRGGGRRGCRRTSGLLRGRGWLRGFTYLIRALILRMRGCHRAGGLGTGSRGRRWNWR